MNDETPDAQAKVHEQHPPIDPAVVQRVLDDFQTEQNFIGALIAGLGASLVGAGLWMVVTVLTGYQIGWVAVGIGFLVGYSVRYAGKGIGTSFAIVGAVFSLFGCLLGNLLTVCQLIANNLEVPLMAVLQTLTPAAAVEIFVAGFSPIDLLFYGIAVFEGYKLSTRRISPEDFQQALKSSEKMSI